MRSDTSKITIKLDGRKLQSGKSEPPSIQIQPPVQAVRVTGPIVETPQNDKQPPKQFAMQPEQEEDAMDRLLLLREQRLIQPAVTAPKQETQQEGHHVEGGREWSQPDRVWTTASEPAFWSNSNRKKGSFWKRPGMKLFLSVAGAIFVGLHFGFLVLAVFMNEQLSHTYQAVLDDTVQTLNAANPKTEQPAKENVSTAPAGGAEPITGKGTIRLSGPEQRMFMAQGGVFRDVKAAEEAVKPLSEKRYPHMYYEAEEKQYVFLAAATSRDQILGLATTLKGAGTDIYVKEVTFPGIQKELSGVEATADPQLGTMFMANSFELVRALADWSGQMMRDGKAVKLPAAEDARVTELHRRLLEHKKVLEQLLPESAKAELNSMVNGINQAVTAYSQAKNQNAESYAWQVQKGVLQFVESYVRFAHQLQS